MNKEEIYQDLLNVLDKAQILQDEPMKNHTTFRIGGLADFMIKGKDKKDIVQVYNYAKKSGVPFYIVGKASNLLVKDTRIRGIVVKNLYDKIEVINDTADFIELDVASGTPIVKLAKYALENSLEGLEFSYGIPGTVGGAVRMNAGAYGGEFKDCVVTSTILDVDGNEQVLDYEDHGFVYRNSSIAINNYILLSVRFRLKKGNKEEIEEKMKNNIEARVSKQPYDTLNAGSVFKRGNGFITAALIDEAGLKGKKIGGAMVSEKHAGFIVNDGNATASDVIELIEFVK